MHATDVAVVQLVVLQSASASRAVCVALAVPNSMPASVRLATAEPMLYGNAAVIVGAAKTRTTVLSHSCMLGESTACLLSQIVNVAKSTEHKTKISMETNRRS